MEINRRVFIDKIFIPIFKSNYTKCAKELGVTPQYVHKFINQENSKAGSKLIGGLISFCDNHGIDFKTIFF